MAGSISVAVRLAVVDGLAERLGALSDFNGTTRGERRLECEFGYDRRSQAAERVFTANASWLTPPASLRAGRNYRDEVGEFDLVVSVEGIGMSPADVAARVDAVGEVIEDWLADRKGNQLGVTGLQTLTVPRGEDAEAGNDRGNIAMRTYRVEYTARLT